MADLSPEAEESLATLNLMARELAIREKAVKIHLDYFQGRHKLAYASDEFRDYFGKRFEGFSDNWCSPVINSPSERMHVRGIRLDDTDRRVDADLERVGRANDVERGLSEAIPIALATGRSFATVWGNPDDEETPTVDFERPDQAMVRYGDRGQRTHSMKLWRDDVCEYASLDDGDHLWKWWRYAHQDGRLRSGLVIPSGLGGWEPREVGHEPWPLPNPMGAPSGVEIANHSLLDPDNPLSDISGVAAMQDSINLIWAYLLNALDYASLPQRVILGSDIPKVPVLNSDGQVVSHRPLDLDEMVKDRVLFVPSKEAKVGEWAAASLDVFSAVIERAIEHIAAQTRTPPHYLIGKIQNVAAEALTAAETGLVSKTRERTAYMSGGIREVYRMVALAQGNEEKARAVQSGVVVWEDFQFRALSQKVDALSKMGDLGFPFRWLAEQYGLDDAEVDYVMRLREEERRELAVDPTIERLLRDVELPPAERAPIEVPEEVV